jgi:uncharacterized protein VirK/YbjX
MLGLLKTNRTNIWTNRDIELLHGLMTKRLLLKATKNLAKVIELKKSTFAPAWAQEV